MKLCIIIVVSLVALSAAAAANTDDGGEKECADQLANLALCIPFVSGSAKQPAKGCCEATTKVKAAQPKCLCVLIKESLDPSIGLPINTTLALQMPAACNIDAKVSDCPSLLNLPADSPDAKIFQAGSTDSPSTSSSTDASKPPPTHSSSNDHGSMAATSNKAPKMEACNALLVMGFAFISVFTINKLQNSF